VRDAEGGFSDIETATVMGTPAAVDPGAANNCGAASY
jgi:hypothetical protein